MIARRLAWIVLAFLALPLAAGCGKRPPPVKGPIQPGDYKVLAGDDLSGIALRAYGDMNCWQSLLNANPQVGSRPRFLSFGAPKPATHRRPKPATMWVVLGGRIVLFGSVGKGRDQVVAV